MARRPYGMDASAMLGCAIALASLGTLVMPTLETPSSDTPHRATVLSATSLLDRRRAVLPAPLTRLVARETEVAAARDALLSPDVRLVTLTGPGGVGKSRVAIQTAWELVDAFAGDVHLVCLATIGKPDLLVSAIAQTLDLPDPGASLPTGRWVPREQLAGPGSAEPVGALSGMLRDRRALLILDNFEPILAAGPLLADLLSGCPDLKALVTSRERLKIRGERVLRIPPLATPTQQESDDLVALRQNPSVRLLMQQALEVVPDFHLTDDNGVAIAEIVRRLDGLPLAIELAAARLVLFTPDELMNRLQKRLSLLSGGASDLPDRLRTMRDAIAWSYDLLAPEEQRLFRGLSIIANSFTLEAAEYVGGTGGKGERGGRFAPGGGEDDLSPSSPFPPSYPSVIDRVASLVDKSFLYHQVAGGEARYAMLEIVREFGLEQLLACGEGDEARRRHAEWWLVTTERTAAVGIQHRDASLWLDRLELNDDDLRAALTWFENAGEVERYVRLTAALVWFWRFRSYRTEGRHWLEQAIDLARAANVRTPDVPRVLAGAAVLAMTQGDYSEANRLAAECLVLSQQTDDVWGATAALNLMGVLARADGDLERSAELLNQALRLAEQHALGELTALVLLNLGKVAYWQGDAERGIALGNEALALLRRQEDDYGVATALSDLALMASRDPDRSRPAALLAESLDAWRRVGTKEGLVEWLARVGILAIACRRVELGVSLLSAVKRAGEAFRYRFEPRELALQERALETARSALGQKAYTAALAEGHRFSLEGAIAIASELLASLQGHVAAVVPQEKTTPYGLTPRELDVLRLLIDGRSDRQIADVLSISHRTVMRHVEHILSKLAVETRTAAATQAVRLGLV